MNKLLLAAALALLAGACGGTTTPTPPPVIEDPPRITCPVLPPIQLLTGTTSAPITYVPTTVNGKPPVATACAPASGTMFNVGTTTVTCTATDALQRAAVCSFAITVLAVVPPPKLAVTRFFAFGDSITKGEDGSNATATALRFYPRVIVPDAQTYPFVLQQLLADRYKTQSPAVKNAGQPSEALSDAGTLDRFTRLTSSGLYDAALIMEGTNDLYKARNSGSDPAGVQQLALARLRTMIRDAKSRNIRPFVATIPPMNPAGSRGQVFGWELVSSFNDSIRSIVSLENVALADVHQAFGGNLALLSADGVHPNPGGYQKIAETFFTAIKSTAETATPSPTFTAGRR